MRAIILIYLLASTLLTSFSQSDYKITVVLAEKELPIFLGHYVGNIKTLCIDDSSFLDENGIGIFNGGRHLSAGWYTIIIKEKRKKQYFNFFVGSENQNIRLKQASNQSIPYFGLYSNFLIPYSPGEMFIFDNENEIYFQYCLEMEKLENISSSTLDRYRYLYNIFSSFTSENYAMQRVSKSYTYNMIDGQYQAVQAHYYLGGSLVYTQDYTKGDPSIESAAYALKVEIDKMELGKLNIAAKYIDYYSNTFSSKLIKASLKIEDYTLICNQESKNSRSRTNLSQKSLYFDYFDVFDIELLHTPIYEEKLLYYIDVLVKQSPDSIKNEVDILLSKSRSNKEIFAFILETLFNHYKKCHNQNLQQIYPYIAERYYIKEAVWRDPKYLKRIEKELRKN